MYTFSCCLDADSNLWRTDLKPDVLTTASPRWLSLNGHTRFRSVYLMSYITFQVYSNAVRLCRSAMDFNITNFYVILNAASSVNKNVTLAIDFDNFNEKARCVASIFSELYGTYFSLAYPRSSQWLWCVRCWHCLYISPNESFTIIFK